MSGESGGAFLSFTQKNDFYWKNKQAKEFGGATSGKPDGCIHVFFLYFKEKYFLLKKKNKR